MQYFKGIFKIFILFFTFVFYSGCSDNATVVVFDGKITEEKVPCLRLVLFREDEMITSTLQELYQFDKRCDFKLEVSKKAGITCNSNQNIQKKALSNFPSSYLKMQIRKNNTLKYSYYIDLEGAVTSSDVQKGFKRIIKDLKLSKD